jgi:hypothetical protein
MHSRPFELPVNRGRKLLLVPDFKRTKNPLQLRQRTHFISRVRTENRDPFPRKGAVKRSDRLDRLDMVRIQRVLVEGTPLPFRPLDARRGAL